MAGIHIYQIYYSERTKRENDPGFLGLDNLANPRPDWSEYWPIRNFLLDTRLAEDDYYGFFSPKFKEKTNLDAGAVHEFVKRHAGDTDVMLFSPFYDLGAFTLNMFEQGAAQHKGAAAALRGSVALVAPTVDLATLVMDSRNIVFCNYLVAKPAVWRVWLAACELIFQVAEENRTELAAELNAGTNHGDGGAPNKVFVIERIASLLLSTQHSWKVQVYDPALLQCSSAPISKYPRELLQLDALKMASATLGYPQYLSVFSKVRQSIVERLQNTTG